MREYMNTQHLIDSSFKTGDQWYEEQAYRAINQGLGRCIRHNRDYGAILLLDSRFNQPKFCSRLSRWFRDSVRVSTNDQQLLTELSSFFAECARMFPVRMSVKRERVKDEPESVTASQENDKTVIIPRESSLEMSLTQPSSIPLVNRASSPLQSQEDAEGDDKPLLSQTQSLMQSQTQIQIQTQTQSQTQIQIQSQSQDRIKLEILSQPSAPLPTVACPFCKETISAHWSSTYLNLSFIKCLSDYRDDLLSQNKLPSVYSPEERMKVWCCSFNAINPLLSHFCLDMKGNTVIMRNGDNSNEVYNETDKSLYAYLR